MRFQASSCPAGDTWVGIGETYLGYHLPQVVPAIVEYFAPILLAADGVDTGGFTANTGFDVAGLRKLLVTCSQYWGRVGVGATVISAIEAALWDLNGKILGVPAYELLGGLKHERLLGYGYATGGVSNWPMDQLRTKVDRYLAHGFRGFKLGAGRFDKDGQRDSGDTHRNTPPSSRPARSPRFETMSDRISASCWTHTWDFGPRAIGGTCRRRLRCSTRWPVSGGVLRGVPALRGSGRLAVGTDHPPPELAVDTRFDLTMIEPFSPRDALPAELASGVQVLMSDVAPANVAAMTELRWLQLGSAGCLQLAGSGLVTWSASSQTAMTGSIKDRRATSRRSGVAGSASSATAASAAKWPGRQRLSASSVGDEPVTDRVGAAPIRPGRYR